MKGKALLWASLVLPATAIAQDAAPGPSGALDAYIVPRTDVEVRVPGSGQADVKGEGYGLRALVHMTDALMVTGEFQSTTYDDLDVDRTDFRLGGGYGLATGTGVFAEYVKIDGDGIGGDGFGLHARWAGSLIPSINLHAQAGYVQVEDIDRFAGFEFSVGGAYQITNMIGAMLDYRVNNFEGRDSQVELKLRDFRVGIRWNFGVAEAAPDVGDGEPDVSVEPVEGEGAPAEAPPEIPAEEVPAGDIPVEEAPADAPAEAPAE